MDGCFCLKMRFLGMELEALFSKGTFSLKAQFGSCVTKLAQRVGRLKCVFQIAYDYWLIFT
jgi:hypothetical protein